MFSSGYAEYESGAALYRVSASGGEPEILATPDLDKGEDWYFAPHILPDGKDVLFTIRRGGDSYQIAVLSLETGEKKILIEGGRQASYGHLAKEPDDRYQLIHEVRTNLGELLEESGDSISQVAAGPSGASSTEAWWRRAIPWSIAMVAVVVASLALWSLTRPTHLPLRKFVITLPSTAFLRNDGSNDLAISPDGRQFVYHAGSERGYQLYLRSLDDFVNRPIPGTEGVGGSAFFSSDGESVGFFKGSQLKKVSLSGGPAVTLCEVAIPRGRLGSWGPDDTIVFSAGYAERNLL